MIQRVHHSLWSLIEGQVQYFDNIMWDLVWKSQFLNIKKTISTFGLIDWVGSRIASGGDGLQEYQRRSPFSLTTVTAPYVRTMLTTPRQLLTLTSELIKELYCQCYQVWWGTPAEAPIGADSLPGKLRFQVQILSWPGLPPESHIPYLLARWVAAPSTAQWPPPPRRNQRLRVCY